METLAWANNALVLHDTDLPGEGVVYSVVSDTSVENRSLSPIKQDHEYDTAELLNQCDSQTHTQYNKLHREYNTSIFNLADNDLRPNVYDTIGETHASKADLHETKYDAVANSGTELGQVAIEIQTSHKQNQIVSLSYETVYQVANEKRKEESTDYGVNDFFDDERYSKPLKNVSKSFDDSTPKSIPRRAAVHDNSVSSAHPAQSEAAEYTEPFVSKRTKLDETEAQTIACSNEHYYHSLEQENAGVLKAQKLTELPVRKAEVNDESYTRTPTTFSYSMETLNDLDSPILHNIEDCEFDDSVSHKSLVILHPTRIETRPPMTLTSHHDEMDVISSAMDINPELLVNYDDAPEYSDPIELTSVHNEPSNRYREVNGSEVDLIFDDPIYA